MKSVTLFGATGSVGQGAVDLIGRDPSRYRVEAITGGQNIELLAADAKRLGAALAVTAHEARFADLKAALAGTGIEVAAGEAGLREAAGRGADWVLSAIVGAAGLMPGLEALKAGSTLALANKESLVTAGPLLLETARAHGATILPVDSEHSAIFQALRGEDIARVERITITASGGAFRDWPLERLAQATPEEAATHPNWDMGQRITIDSASMFNKAMEVIETKEFFGVAPEQIEVLVHRESLVHALVGFTDGAVIAHLGAPDMRHAIGYALHWPERGDLPVDRLDLARAGQLTFEAPDRARFPALDLAWRVMEEGGLQGAAFNAAKEQALDLFLDRRIGFLDMARVVEAVLDRMSGDAKPADGIADLDTILDTDRAAREHARNAAIKIG